MATRQEIIAAAREWIGTPFQHHAHLKGIGSDCVGFIGGVGVETGLLPADFWTNAFAPFAGYGRQPANGLLVRNLRGLLPEIDPNAAQVADVLVLRFDSEPQHVGFLAPYRSGGLSLLHCLSTAGRPTPSGRVGMVTEHRLCGTWRARVTHAFQLPGVVSE